VPPTGGLLGVWPRPATGRVTPPSGTARVLTMLPTKDPLTKILAFAGTVLAWLPLLFPLVLGLLALGTEGQFHLDYLMPAELFPVAFLGGGLLLWAALRAHQRRGLIGGALAAAAALLVASQGLAVATGLASGAIEPAGWPLALVLSLLAAYTLALVVLGLEGLLLLRDIIQRAAGAPRHAS
jgi:hypothetical protein